MRRRFRLRIITPVNAIPTRSPRGGRPRLSRPPRLLGGYLRDRWATRLSAHPEVRIHTNLAPEHSCEIRTVQHTHVPTATRRAAVVRLAHHRHTDHSCRIRGVRVTPNVYTTIEEIDTFASAMQRIAQRADRPDSG